MYKAFFGFTKNPFDMSPDPSFLFRSAQHEEALANLIYGVQSRKLHRAHRRGRHR